MKVLWFSHLVPYPETGLGVLQRSYHLVRELSRAHEVHLLAFVQRKIIADLLGNVDEGIERANQHLRQYCARVQFLPIPSDSSSMGRIWLAGRSLAGGYPYTIRWLQSDVAQKVAADWNSSNDFDVVHFDTLSLAPYREIFTRGASSLDHHNIESDMMLRRACLESHPLKRLYFWQEGRRLQQYERRVCPQFDVNITCSSLDTERLKCVAPGAVVTEVPNGVDINYFRPNRDLEEPGGLVFAGNMAWYPNAAAMLFFADKVWPALKAEYPGVTMDVVGGSPPPRLSALAARDRDFRVHGHVPDVRPYIGRAAVYVCPIMDGGGTKLKILDALAMGKPIVAHPISCEGIAVQDGRDVILAREPDEFARSIVALLKNPERRSQLSLSARSLAESTYSYSFIGRRLINEIERCHESRLGRHANSIAAATVERSDASGSVF